MSKTINETNQKLRLFFIKCVLFIVCGSILGIILGVALGVVLGVVLGVIQIPQNLTTR
ncbi:hypothetical protein [Catenovulum sediminis]|uniref:Serine protease n=1 Tax=Catenovulum sediminis TaxID=1740262 RepID=A0ABV1RC35_9ALTE|nr:hypothetical protein [Catenovulum sediminis]